MKTVGIVAEYNPFHPGHQYQISMVRELYDADYVVAVMSGDFVQRGMPAFLPKHVRSKMALLGGADLVLEMPVSVSTSSAEAFAKGAVEILDSLNTVDLLCFGSEAGEIRLFEEIAESLVREPDAYRERLQRFLRQGMTFPEARSRALLFDYPKAGDFLASPNNILGVEYCKALLKLSSSIRPVTILRRGSGYHDTRLTAFQAPSASAIRSFLAGQKPPYDKLEESLLLYLSPESAAILADSIRSGAFVTEEQLDLLLHCALLTAIREETLTDYLDVSEALARRISNTVNQYQSFSQYVSLLKTREITQTRIQRALLHILLHIKKVPEAAGYVRVLGFRKSAAPLLSAIKKQSRIPLLTKAADAAGLLDRASLETFQETVYASNIYESLLVHKTHKAFVHEYQKPVIII